MIPPEISRTDGLIGKEVPVVSQDHDHMSIISDSKQKATDAPAVVVPPINKVAKRVIFIKPVITRVTHSKI